jgi:hypothetical protein
LVQSIDPVLPAILGVELLWRLAHTRANVCVVKCLSLRAGGGFRIEAGGKQTASVGLEAAQRVATLETRRPLG